MLLGTYWGTQWELETDVDGNILETTKIQPPFPLTLPQKTKTWVAGVHVVGSPHWVPRISVPILARSCWNSMGVSGWFKKLVEHSVWFWAGFFKFLKLYLVMVFFKRSPIPVWLGNWRVDWWGALDSGPKPSTYPAGWWRQSHEVLVHQVVVQWLLVWGAASG